MRLVAVVDGVPVYMRPLVCEREQRCVCRRRKRRVRRLATLPDEPDPVEVHNRYAMLSVIADDPREAYERLRAAGFKLSPYSINGCVIVTAPSVEEALGAVRVVSDVAREAYILNTVWDAFVEPAPLLPLLRHGFVPTAPGRVKGYVVPSVSVTVFQSGLVRVSGPITGGEARVIAGRVARLLRGVGDG